MPLHQVHPLRGSQLQARFALGRTPTAPQLLCGWTGRCELPLGYPRPALSVKKSPKDVKGQLRHDFNPGHAVRLHQRLADIDILEPLCSHRSYPHIIGGHDGSMVQVPLIADQGSFGAGGLRRQRGAERSEPVCFSTRQHCAVQEG